MRKKKIIITASQVPFNRGGAELHVNFLLQNLISRGYDAEIVALPYKWYPENSLYDSMLAWRLIDLSESNGEKIDLVIATKFPSYGAIHSNKVSWVIHQYRQVYDLYDTKEGLKYSENGERIKARVELYDKKCLLESRKIFANSQNVANRLKKYNDIDAEALYHPPSLVGRYFTEGYGDYILSVGRLDRLKRNALLLESMCFCDKSIKAKIAGKGPEMEELRRAAKKLNILERVEFLGYVPDDDLLKLYANAFAVYFAPIDEDYGYISLEAYLSKKPVITCNDSGGVLEFVKNNENGYITLVDAKELGQCINKLYNNKKLCQEFGEEGYNKVKDISWDNVIDKLTCTLR